jgi:cytochrome c oxidase cbb3-type subunit IV
MDVNDLRIAVTVVGFFLFVAIVVWTYRPARKAQFDDAAQLPFRSE